MADTSFLSDHSMDRRTFLRRSALLAGFVAAGGGSFLSACSSGGGASGDKGPIKLGVLTDLTGALAYAGVADANTAKMVVDEINAKGGLLGRQIQIFLEDSASTESVGVTKATKLIQQDHVDLVVGGITSSMRQAIKGPLVERGKTLYIYPQLYEGKECTPLIYCSGPVPAQQVDPFIPWLMQKTGAKKFYLPSADYVWPHTLNGRVRQVVTASGGQVAGEEYFPIDATDYSTVVNKIMSSGTDVVFVTVIPPGITPFLQQLYTAGFTKRGGSVACVYFDENLLNIVPAQSMEGLYSCLDFFQNIEDPFSKQILDAYNTKFPGSAKFTAGSAATGVYRGLKLWEAAVKEAGSLKQQDVVKALDHAKIAEGPGGPAEMVPGQNHARMNMYIAQAHSGSYTIEKNLGAIDPKECVQGVK